MPMEKSEIEYFASLLLEKERDIVVYEQAMINFLAMLRGSKTANDLTSAVSREIVRVMSFVDEKRKSLVDDALDSSRRLYRDGHLVFEGKDNV